MKSFIFKTIPDFQNLISKVSVYFNCRKMNPKDESAESTTGKKDDETYVRSGLSRTFHGVLYQLKLTMLFMKLGANKKYQFRMAMEREDAGKFDDIEFRYTDQGVEKCRLIQVKHRYDDSSIISAEALESTGKSDFCIKKYFESYLKIRKVFKGIETLKDLIVRK
jgi:hypothetical protein